MKSFLTRAVIFLSLLTVGMLITLNVGFYFFFNQYNGKINSLISHHARQITERTITDKCSDIAVQLEIYLDSQRELSHSELLNTETFKKIIRQNIGGTGYLALIDESGIILFQPQKQYLNKNYSTLKKSFRSLYQILSNAIQQGRAQGYYSFSNSLHQSIEKFISAKKIAHTGWVLAVTQDANVCFQPVIEINRRGQSLKISTLVSFVILSVLWCAIIILLTFVFIRRITSNINALTEQAIKINYQNLDFYPPVTKTKEMNELGNAIKKMTDGLQESFQKNLTLQCEMTQTVITLNNILNSAARYGIVVTDRYGNIQIFNNGAEILFNYSSDEIKGQPITLIHDEGELENKGFEFYMEYSEDNGYFDRNMTGIRKDKTKFPMALHATIRFNGELDFEGFVIILYDRTEEKMANSLKIQSEYQAEQLRNIEIIINSLPIGVIVTDKNSEVVIENDSARNILCFKEDATSVGLNLFEVRAFKHPKIHEIMQKTIADKEHHKLNNVQYLPVGQKNPVYLDIHFTPLLSLENENNGSIISFEDKTLLTLSMKKMQELDTVISKSPVIAYKLSISGEYTFEYISENISIFGYKPEELYKSKISFPGIIHPEDAKDIDECIKQNTNCTLQFRMMTKLGNIRWVENTLWIYKTPDGKVKGIDGIFIDITERKTAEEEYRKAQKIIERQVSILKKYVDQSVLDFMMEGEEEGTFNLLKSEVINATICFIDICGFTAISETHPADIVVKMLNKYFDVIVHELISRNGHVDKFIGDAIMAVFKGDFQIERAVEACIAIRNRVTEMSGETIEGITFSPNVSIGINMGDMISGNIGSETIERLDYTVIGDVVNTASRFQSTAKDGQILVSEQMHELMKEFVLTEPLGKVHLKNKEKPVAIYNVIDFK